MPEPLGNAVGTIALVVIVGSALLYLPMQVFALARLRGGWRLASLLPLVYVAGMVAWMFVKNAQITRENPGMEPGVLLTLPLLLSMPIPAVYLAVVIWRGTRASGLTPRARE